MTTNSSESGSRSVTKANNPKKANLMDPHSIKHLLDESVSDLIIYTKKKNAILFTYPFANKTEVHSYQKITPCDVDYGIRIMGGLPIDFKTSSNQIIQTPPH